MRYPELPSNRTFGLFFSGIFALGCFRYFEEGVDVAAWAFAFLAIVFAALALTKPEVLLPLNRLWMRFGLLLGAMVSPVVLGVIFFLFFFPAGFLMRLFGRDELRLKHRQANSYWRIRNQEDASRDSFDYQF